MPPIIFIAAVAAEVNSGAGSLEVETPLSVRPGDELFLVMAFQTGAFPVEGVDGSDSIATADGWSYAYAANASNTLVVMRRTATDDEPGVHTATFTSETSAKAALIVYRGTDPSVDLVPTLNSSTAVKNHVCPSQTLPAYSSLYLGIVMLIDGTAVTPPAGTTVRLSAEDGGGSITLLDRLPEILGATGTKTATTVANKTGLAASLLIGAGSVARGKTFSMAPIGAIGLPTVGV